VSDDDTRKSGGLEIHAEVEIRYEDGLVCPHIVCDVCHEPIAPIADRATGNVLWKYGDEANLYFTHKGCYPAFKARHEQETHYSWQDLTAFVFYLTNNTEYDPEAGREAVGVRASSRAKA
jgi:hypothetical protein